MSSSAQDGSGGGTGDKSQGFSKFMRRASKVLRRGSSNKDSLPTTSEVTPAARGTKAAVSSPAPVGSAPTIAPLDFDPSGQNPSTLASKPIQEETATAPSVPAAIQQSIRDIKPSSKSTNNRLAMTAATSSAIQEEKARILFAKYGLILEPGEWTPPVKGDTERVEKKIRMRIHRTCHRCQVMFGREKVCSNCAHNRCKKCPKFPTRRSKGSHAKGLEAGGAAAAGKDATKGKSKMLTMPSRVTGKVLTRKAPSQRVRRTCHKCDTLFLGEATECGNCQHVRCPQCPREPSKTEKYPDGYAGDVEERFPLASRQHRTIRTHVRWTCHTCSTLFKDKEKTCDKCGHSRCNECTRQPPKNPKPELDEAAIRSVEERLKNIHVSPQAVGARPDDERSGSLHLST